MVIIEHETIITATKSAVINLTKLIFFQNHDGKRDAT
jgi:hypothetical protein